MRVSSSSVSISNWDQTAAKGTIHSNTASRNKARLAKRLAALEATVSARRLVAIRFREYLLFGAGILYFYRALADMAVAEEPFDKTQPRGPAEACVGVGPFQGGRGWACLCRPGGKRGGDLPERCWLVTPGRFTPSIPGTVCWNTTCGRDDRVVVYGTQ